MTNESATEVQSSPVGASLKEVRVPHSSYTAMLSVEVPFYQQVQLDRVSLFCLWVFQTFLPKIQ